MSAWDQAGGGAPQQGAFQQQQQPQQQSYGGFQGGGSGGWQGGGGGAAQGGWSGGGAGGAGGGAWSGGGGGGGKGGWQGGGGGAGGWRGEAAGGGSGGWQGGGGGGGSWKGGGGGQGGWGGGGGGQPPMAGSGWGSGWQGGGGWGGRPGDRMGNLGRGLHEVNWREEHLSDVKKDTYEPSEITASRPDDDVARWRAANNITVEAVGLKAEIPKPVLTFAEAPFPPFMLEVFRRCNYAEPTPIQAQAWPIALSGHNMVGIAKTGSGKTLAFAVPSIIHIQRQPPLSHGDGPIGLFISPTRELAVQIEESTRKVARDARISTACIFGGVSRGMQARQCRGAAIIIATPGRMIDFLESYTTNLKRCTYLVLDEADRMLDMGFEPQIRSILSQVRPDRQTLMYSATWPKEVRQLAREFLKEWVQINVGYQDIAANADVRQHIWFVEEHNKRQELMSLLEQIKTHINKVLIFVQTKAGVENLADFLRAQGVRALTIHGDKKQNERDHALNLFRRSPSSILIATDVAQRGLDIRDLPAVINYDFPDQLEDYVHRIGRTGRAGDIGDAYSFFTPSNAGLARELVQVLRDANQPIDPFLEQVAANTGRGGGGGGGRMTRFGRPQYGGKGRRY